MPSIPHEELVRAATGVGAIHRKLASLVLAIAPEDARPRLEALMATTEYKSDFLDRIEAEGIKQGEVLGEAKAVVKVLRSRGIELTDEQRATAASSTDRAQVDRWLDKALTATSADDVFKD